MGTKAFQISRGVCAWLLAAGVVQAEVDYSSERYELIVERDPFGSELIAPESAVSPEQEAIEAAQAAEAAERELRLCFLYETDGGDIRAGFQNKTAKPGDPKSLVLGVGESFRGMQLLDVDIEQSTATLDRSGVKVTFSLVKPKVTPAPQKVLARTPRRFGRGFQRNPDPPTPPPTPPPEPPISPEEQSRRREEVRENLRQYQMEVIRAGLPPLPIPLTKEMDDQLVAEGILPPE